MRRVRAGRPARARLAAASAAAEAAARARAIDRADEAHGLGRLEARELSVFKKVVAEYDKAHPNVNVNVVGNINDDKIVAAIRAGNGARRRRARSTPTTSASTAAPAAGSTSRRYEAVGIATTMFPPAPNYYTQYEGKHCALPLLADDYGLYYNKALFKQAGIAGPPKTIAELTADAKKLTKNPDGSIKVLGFDPVLRLLREHARALGDRRRRQVARRKGNSILAKAPGWSRWLKWQK